MNWSIFGVFALAALFITADNDATMQALIVENAHLKGVIEAYQHQLVVQEGLKREARMLCDKPYVSGQF